MPPAAEPVDPGTEDLEIEAERIAVGGDAIGHDADGRVVFVAGLLPGERATVRITEKRKRHAFAEVVGLETASPARRDPPCRHVEAGCGGCDWMHIRPEYQRQLRVDTITDAFGHLAGLDTPEVATVALAETGYRTTLRVATAVGGVGFHARRSGRVVPVDDCVVAHPLAEQLVTEGDFGVATEAMIRVGANTGERLVLASPSAEAVVMPDDVLVVGSDELDAGRRAWIHEEINGHRFRISAGSFFQASAAGAAALTDVVSAAVSRDDGLVLDAYAGVGLLSKALVTDHQVIAVERSSSSVADARLNLGSGARVVRTAFERWRPRPVSVAVADPARQGLGARGVARLVGARPHRIILVSCEASAAARDVRLLVDHGFVPRAMTSIDQFSGTSHVELVTVLDRPES